MSRPPAFKRCVIEPRFFPQHEIDPAKVARYKDALADGATFPPAIVVRYGDEVMPIDGHHRLAAHAALNKPCDVWECGERAFENFACKVGSFEADRLILEAYQ